MFCISQSKISQDDEDVVRGCDGGTNLKIYTKALLFYTSTLKGDYNRAREIWSNLKPLAKFNSGNSVENG